MKKQAGFTLIELIMVIVILGILSAFALPRFADLSGNAEAAKLSGALAGVTSANAIARAACLANTTCDTGVSGSSVALDGSPTTDMDFGYPSNTGILSATDLSGYTIATVTDIDAGTAGTQAGVIVTNDAPTAGDNCVFYIASTAAGTASSVGQGAFNTGDGTAGSNTCD